MRLNWMSNSSSFTVIETSVDVPRYRQEGTIVRDVPLFGYPCIIDIQLAQVFISKNERRMESCEFVDKGYRFTHRLPYDQWPVSPHEHSGRC
ncbi:MAG: hypothetical protein L3J62_07710 [Gammaproteobacteria bacterium]|nr:hypothetical protein [Gammaproteobacteria bacterium]